MQAPISGSFLGHRLFWLGAPWSRLYLFVGSTCCTTPCPTVFGLDYARTSRGLSCLAGTRATVPRCRNLGHPRKRSRSRRRIRSSATKREGGWAEAREGEGRVPVLAPTKGRHEPQDERNKFTVGYPTCKCFAPFARSARGGHRSKLPEAARERKTRGNARG